MFHYLFEYIQQNIDEAHGVQDALRDQFGTQRTLPQNPDHHVPFFLLSDGSFVDISRSRYHEKAAAKVDSTLPDILDSGAIRGIFVKQGEVDLSTSGGIVLTPEQKASLQLFLDYSTVQQAFLEQDDGNYFVKADEVRDFAGTVINILSYRPTRKKFLYPRRNS